MMMTYLLTYVSLNNFVDKKSLGKSQVNLFSEDLHGCLNKDCPGKYLHSRQI